jgi:hypothetical protein
MVKRSAAMHNQDRLLANFRIARARSRMRTLATKVRTHETLNESHHERTLNVTKD